MNPPPTSPSSPLPTSPSSGSPSDPDFGRSLPRMGVPPAGPRARALAARLARVESRNVTFLGSADAGAGSGADAAAASGTDPSAGVPIFWTAAKGANVLDADGNLYLDLTGAFGVAVAGHAHPAVLDAMASQGARLVHGMGDVHPPEIKVELLERLAGVAPWPDCRGFLANSGSEAVEAALKTAMLATGRGGILAFEGGYHGLTLGSLNATHRADFREPFAAHLHGGVHFAPFPDALEASGGGSGAEQSALEASLADVDRLLAAAAAAGTPVGAVLVEPVQGRAGVRVPVAGFLAGVAERARRAGAVVIHDEIFSGFGRTGRMFAAEWEGEAARPDLLCVGKALGGGLPLSACLGSVEVMNAWPASTGEALHTSTFLGHPLACATALAFLTVLEEERLVARATATGDRLRAGLAGALDGVPQVRGVRGRGMFLGVVLDGPGAPPAAGVRVAEEALRRGVILLPAGSKGEVVELSPPLVLTPAQADAAVEIVAASVLAVVRR